MSLHVDEIKAATWCKLGELDEVRARCGIACIQDKLYIVGGGPKWSAKGTRKVECFNIGTNSIDRNATSMLNFRRLAVGVAVHQGKIYAVGGKFSNKNTDCLSTNTVEVWDGESWKILEAEMNEARHGMAVVVHNDRLYAIGGYTSQTKRHLRTCEYLDLTESESKQR